jgi:hypothetical protein
VGRGEQTVGYFLHTHYTILLSGNFLAQKMFQNYDKTKSVMNALYILKQSRSIGSAAYTVHAKHWILD